MASGSQASSRDESALGRSGSYCQLLATASLVGPAGGLEDELMTTVLITGASRGIGAATTRRLAAPGVTVWAGARSPSALAERLSADPATADLDIRHSPSTSPTTAQSPRPSARSRKRSARWTSWSTTPVSLARGLQPGRSGRTTSPRCSRPTCSVPCAPPEPSCPYFREEIGRGW